MALPALIDKVLYDLMREALDEAIRDSVDASLASIVYNYGTLPPPVRTGPIVHRVLGDLATYPASIGCRTG